MFLQFQFYSNGQGLFDEVLSATSGVAELLTQQ